MPQSRIDRRGHPALHVQSGAQRHGLAVGADLDGPPARLHLPAAPARLPVAERVVVEGDGDLAALPRGDQHLREAAELAGRAEDAAGGARVQLRHLGAVHVGGVRDREAGPPPVHAQARVLEVRVAQPEAEGEGDGDGGRLEVPVAHIGALAVEGQRPGPRVPLRGGVVLVGARVGLGQAARRVRPPGEDVDGGPRSPLSAQVGVDDGVDPVRPRHLHGGAAREDHDDAGPRRRQGADERVLGVGKAHVLAVEALRLGQLVEPGAHENSPTARGELHSLGDQLVVGAPLALVALGEALHGQSRGPV